jgi:ribonuclease HI
LTISKTLTGFQNILRVELTAIHHALQIITQFFPNESAYIFSDILTSLYLLTTQTKQPTHHNNHLDKIILQSMVEMLQLHSQPTIITKIKAHVNIDGNEKANKLAKDDTKLFHSLPTHPYERAHSTPYHLHKDN